MFVFWFTFLIAIPIGISIVEVELAIQRFPGYPLLAAVALAIFSLLGLWSALTIAVTGRGTPLPADEARRLVVAGPFAYVRNPLAIAAVGQGAAIGLAFGSWPVLLYVAMGAGWFHFYARPREERHLQARFGARWAAYKNSVRAYRPRVSAYRTAEDADKG